MSEQEPRQSDCDTLRALLPAYSIGATDADETLLVERLLPLCPAVAAELDDYQALVDDLNFAAPLVEPPVDLRARILASAGATAEAVDRALGDQPVSNITPFPTDQRYVPVPREGRFNWLAIGLTAVAALLILSNVYWITQVNNLQDQQQDMVALLRDQHDVLAALGTGQTKQVQLVSTTPDDNTVLATVLYQPQNETALLVTDRLPALESGRTYQLWLIAGDQSVSAGIFNVDAQGFGSLIFRSDEPVNDFTTIGISTEPAGGSNQPTNTPLAAGEVSA